ncbi:MAG: helix-turn-helix transcriptional regulator [Planctomycetes bacterium]|nr:helix-turn-helix transcriptional regulator [Planctomycetota bacterium]
MTESNERARKTVDVTVGESVRIVREFQELTQRELSRRARLSRSALSALENDRAGLGVQRAKKLARALKVHPAVLIFPGWDVEEESVA